MTLTAFAAAWALHLVAAASPGPAVLVTARTGVTQGFRAAAWAAAGVGIGACLWALAALTGLALLFKLAPALFWGFKIVGGLLLIWMALKMWRHAPDPLMTEAAGAAPLGRIAALRLTILTQLANPKAAVFFGAVFVGTVPPGTSGPWIAALLVVIFLNEFACNLAVARVFSLAAPRRTYLRLKTRIDRSFAGILALLGARIAAT